MEILKICKVHGPLTLTDVIKSGRLDTIAYRCKICYKETRRKYYENNKEKVLTKCAEYRNNNPEKRADIKEKSRLTHPYSRRKYVQKDYDNWLESKKNLTDPYIKRLICKHSGLRYADIPKNLVDLMRDNRIFKEKIKEIKEVARIDNSDIKMGIVDG